MLPYFAAAAIIGVAVLAWGVGAVVLAWAWNVSMPIIFGLPTIEWFHALALMLVASGLGFLSRK